MDGLSFLYNLSKKRFLNVHVIFLFCMNEEEKNPIQILTDICGQLQRMADSMKVPDPDPLENDIPEIYETAASLLTSIITSKVGFDPNLNVLKQASDYEKDLLTKEKDFVQKMEDNMNQLASKVENAQEQYNKLGILVENTLKDVAKIYENLLSEVDKKNMEKIKSFEEEMKVQVEEHASEEQKIKDDFENELAEHLKAFEKEWVEKVKDADNEVAELQKQVQVAMHLKQEMNQAKLEEIRNLEHANANEIANETKVMNSLKRDEEIELIKLNDQLERLNLEAEEENKKAKRQTEMLEQQMQEEKNKINEINNKELAEIEEELRSLNQKLIDAQNEYDRRKIIANLRMKETEQNYEFKLLQEKEITDKLMNELIEKIRDDYLPKIELVNARILKAEKQKGLSIEELHRASIENTELNENQIIELTKKHQEERNELRAKIRKEKQELQALLDARGTDIEELKNALEGKINEAQNNYDKNEKKHELNVKALLEEFEQKRKEYEEDSKRRVEEAEQKRQTELVRLKNEHNFRVQDLRYRMEQRIKIEGEAAYALGVKEATTQHQRELANINDKIDGYKNQIEAIQQRLRAMGNNHASRLKEIENEKTNELNRNIEILTNEFDKEKNELLRNKKALIMELRKLKKKKEFIEDQIVKMKTRFIEISGNEALISPLDILRQSLAQILAQMNDQESDLIKEKGTIENQIESFKKSIEDLTIQANKKQEELAEFMKHRQETMNAFLASVRSNLEKAFDITKAKPIAYEEERIRLRNQMDDEISQLQKELLNKRKEAEEQSIAMIKNKDEKLIKLENDLQKEFDDRISNLENEHQQRMDKLNQELEDIRSQHEANMLEIQRKYDADVKTLEQNHQKKLDDLYEEKRALYNQEKLLQEKLDNTETPQCSECNNRRETILRLTQRRDDLLERLEEMNNASVQTDHKVSSMFPKRANPGLTGTKSALGFSQPSTSFSPKSPRVTMLRNKSAMKKSIITPKRNEV